MALAQPNCAAFPGYYHIDAAVSIHNARQNASSGNVVATSDGDVPWELVELESETVGGHQHNASHIEAVDACETPKDAMSDDPEVNANVVHDKYDRVSTEHDGNASRPLAELVTEFDSPEELAVDCTGIVMSDGCESNAQEISDDETIHTAIEANGVNIRTESDDNITSSEHRVHVELGTNGQQHCESLDGVAVRSSEIAEEDEEEMKLEVSVESGTMSITTQGSDDNGANDCMDNDDDTMAQCIDEPLHAGDDDMQKNADVHGKPALVTSVTAEEYNELLIWANELMDDYEVVHGKARMLQKKLKAAQVAAQESEERAVEMAKANVTLQDEIDRLTRQVSEGELTSGQCFTSPGVPIASDCRRRQGVSINRWGFPKPQATAATIAPTPPTRQRTHGIVPRPKPQ